MGRVPVTSRPLGCHSDPYSNTTAARSGRSGVSKRTSPTTKPTPYPPPLFRPFRPLHPVNAQPDFTLNYQQPKPPCTTTITTETSPPPPKIPFTAFRDELADLMVFLLPQRKAVKRRRIVIHQRGLLASSIVTNHRDPPGRL